MARPSSPSCRPGVRLQAWRLAALLFLGIGTAPAQRLPETPGGASELPRSQLHLVGTSRAFQGVNRNDVRAALQVLYDLLAAKRGLILETKVDLFDSLGELRTRLDSHTVDVAVLGASDYFQLEGALSGPVLTDARSTQGAGVYSYVLLVRPSSGITSLAALRKKNIMVSSRGGGSTGSVWLEVTLAREKLGRAASFFNTVRPSSTAKSCILPLFFGAVDACVVDEITLNLARELNPQLRQLTVVRRSRPLIESVISTPRTSSPFHKDLVDAMLSLHDDPRGRQLLMVFRTERLVRIQPHDLEGARELWREYHHLSGVPPNIPATNSGLSAGIRPQKGTL